MTDKDKNEFFSSIGKKGGQSRSLAKIKAVKENAKKAGKARWGRRNERLREALSNQE